MEKYDGVINKPDLDEALQHYGVMGMKWGVRKDPARAWDRANKELAKRKKKSQVKTQKAVIKFTKKAARTDKKLAKISKKYVKALNKPKILSDKDKINDLFVKKEKLTAKSAKLNSLKSKAQSSHAKASKRTSRWEEQMRKAFAGTDYAKNFKYSNKELARIKKKKRY